MDKSDKKNAFFSYEELKKLVKERNVNTKQEYINTYKTLSKDKKAPLNPCTFYGKEIWQNWSIFLDKPIFKKKLNNLYYSYEECSNIIQKLKITSKSQFFKEVKNLINKDPSIPYSPYKTYETEWKSWGEFLGTKKIQDNQIVFLPFEDARNWARSLNLKLSKEWRKLDLDKLPDGITKKPERTYKNKGWINYYDWLGIERKTKISFGEKKIFDFLSLNKIHFEYNTTVSECKNEIKLRFDFFLPQKNICIEFDGIQHFKPIEYFGGIAEFIKQKKRDKIKDDFCKLNGLYLIRIPYFFDDEKIIEILKKEVI